MLMALAVIALSIIDAWWTQEKERLSGKWSLSIQPDFQNVSRGENETLKCRVYDLPDHTHITKVSWFVNQHDSDQFSQLSLDPEKYLSVSNEEPSLTIMNFQPEDEGTYKCEIENDVGLKKSGSSYLAFIDLPIPETLPINKDCIKYSTQTVTCNVRGNQPKDLQWVKVSKGTAKTIKISLSSDKYSGGTVEKPSLCINNFVMEDEGTYVCCAVNDAGIGSSKGTFLTYILDASDQQNLEDNFHRLVTLVHIAGDVTRKYFDICILKANTFRKYLETNIHNIVHLHEPHPCCKCSFKCCKCTKTCSCKCKCKCLLTQDQISTLFVYDKQFFNRRHTRGKGESNQRCVCPYRVKSSVSLSVVDITLLSVIIANVDGVNKYLGVDKKFEDIRKVRNYVFHQSDSQSIKQDAFEIKWKKLIDSTELVFQHIGDVQYKENINKKINEIRGSIRISSDSFVQQQIFQEFWRDKCAELEQRKQEEFRESFSRFEQIFMDEDTLTEPTQTLASKIGQGRMPVLLQIDVPDYWDEKDITKAFRDIQATQMNKETGVKIKSYSIQKLNIIIDVVKTIMNDIHELNHEVMPLISGFLSYIDTKEKADVNLKMIAPEKLKLKIGPSKKKVSKGCSHTIECNISGKPSPFIINWTKKNHGEEIAIGALQERYSGGTVECPSLTIECFVIDDEGIYVCRATNEAGVGLSNESKLTYIEKPKVSVSPERQNVAKGKAQILMCSVSGTPPPHITWMKENNGTKAIINLPSEKYSGGKDDVPSLTLIDFNEEDDGIYVCKATNEAGEALSNKSHLTYIEPPTAKVTPDRQNVVKEPPTATVSPGRQNVVKGKAPTLNCSVSGKPLPIFVDESEQWGRSIFTFRKDTGEMLMFLH
ncbi:Hypothetical predicted protein [Mytilus galloprovincialis]|uniref:Ig-like domain-containing protein n=1 Tax=Mytilus galloprovincialis TaxID=29158 RepID=A0A8B6EDN0_MYTGA|nr:Hypothetical predicted protein [Mytilus galloprovincialis]